MGVITDDTVDALYAAKAVWAMEQYGYDVCKYVIPYGESSKNINTLSGILEYFASCHFTRKDIFLSIGGGVIGGHYGSARCTVYARHPFYSNAYYATLYG